MFDFSQLSDSQLKQLLISVGMREDIANDLFRIFRKRVSPKPKGYVPTKNITRQLVANSLSLKDRQENTVEVAKLITIANLANLTIPIPWYWLTEELAEDLVRVEFSDTIPQNFNLPDFGIIVLPEGILTTSTGNIDYIAYYLFQPGQKSTFIGIVNDGSKQGKRQTINTEFEGELGHRLAWVATQNVYVYAGIYGLLAEDNHYKIIAEDSNYIEDPELEDKEAKQISSLLLNCLIYASQNEIEYTQTYSKGFGITSTKDKSKKQYDRPIFIGKNHKSVVRRTIAEYQGKGSPKKLHWRKGHWRRVAVGEGRKGRAWRLIPPTIVGLKKGEN